MIQIGLDVGTVSSSGIEMGGGSGGSPSPRVLRLAAVISPVRVGVYIRVFAVGELLGLALPIWLRARI